MRYGPLGAGYPSPIILAVVDRFFAAKRNLEKRIDVANRIHNYSPSTERMMHATVRYDGTVRQYRLFRMHVNMATDSKLYPYDTQRPSIKLQSLDYGADMISLTVKVRVANFVFQLEFEQVRVWPP